MAGLPTRHPIFYFDEPDTVAIQFGQILFRIHTVFIRRYLPTLNDAFEISEHAPATPDAPLVLKDVDLGQGRVATEVTHEDFAIALRAMYPDYLLRTPPQTNDEWRVVLKIALRWNSSYLEELALGRLLEHELSLRERLDMALNYEQHSWLAKAYLDVCLLRDFPSSDLLDVLPPAEVRPILAARDAARLRFMTIVGSAWDDCLCDVNSPCVMNGNDRRIRGYESLGIGGEPGRGFSITSYLLSFGPQLPLEPREIWRPHFGIGICKCAGRYNTLEEECIAASQEVLVASGLCA